MAQDARNAWAQLKNSGAAGKCGRATPRNTTRITWQHGAGRVTASAGSTCTTCLRGPDTTASPSRQMLNTDVITRLPRHKILYTLSPQYELRYTSVSGSPTCPQTRPLLFARQLSHRSYTPSKRPRHYKRAPRHRSGAASLALAPPCPQGPNVRTRRRHLASLLATWRVVHDCGPKKVDRNVV